MLTTIILYLTALLVSAAAGNDIALSVVSSFAERDCKGVKYDAKFMNSDKKSKGHCFDQQPAQSFSNLQLRGSTCKTAYVIAYASDNCKDNKGSFRFSMTTWDAADSCINVDRGFGSYVLGCDSGSELRGVGFTD